MCGHLISVQPLKRRQEIYRTALIPGNVVMHILPPLKSGCASQSPPPGQLVAVPLHWTVAPSTNRPVKDQRGKRLAVGAGRSCLLIRTKLQHQNLQNGDSGLEGDAASLMAHRVTAWGKAKTEAFEGKQINRELDSECENLLDSNNKFHCFSCMHKRHVYLSNSKKTLSVTKIKIPDDKRHVSSLNWQWFFEISSTGF